MQKKKIIIIIYSHSQVILHSQVKANLTIHDSWLDLKDGFTLAGESQSNGRPTSAFFPLVVPSTSRAGILFTISLPTNGKHYFISHFITHL